MLQLLSPLALFGLAALAIPAILHLWRPPPRTIRIGTLRFFTGPAVRRLTKLRWRERLLLAVRLLLLTLLALLIAQPIWRKPAPTQPQRWALVEPGLVLGGEALKRWRELDRSGFETRELARGFAQRPPATRAVDQKEEAPDIWSLLREVDARMPAGSAVAVFTANRLTSLRGERPALQNRTVEWIAATPDQSERNWWLSSVRLRKPSGDAAAELRMIVSTTAPAGTDNVALTVPSVPGITALPAPLSEHSLEIAKADDGKLSARLIARGQPPGEWVAASDKPPLTVAILHDRERVEDARYVRAALSAGAETSDRELVFDENMTRADWIVWLSDQSPARDVLHEVNSRGAMLLTDAENGTAAVESATTIEGAALPQGVALFRRVVPPATAAVPVWTDGFGAPLLLMSQEGRGHILRFSSRFHPDWNDLPRSSALAVALRPLFFGENDETSRDRTHDLRRVDNQQAAPAQRERDDSTSVRLTPASEIVDLHRMLWLLCIALFAVERVLSHRNVSAASTAPHRPVVEEEPALAGHV